MADYKVPVISEATGLTANGVVITAASKQVKSIAGSTGQYLKGTTGGEASWATLNQAAVAGLTTSDTPTFAGGTFNGDVVFASATSAKPIITIANTNADTTGPILSLEKYSVSPATYDLCGTIKFSSLNAAGSDLLTGGIIKAALFDLTAGAEAGYITFTILGGGSELEAAHIAQDQITIKSYSRTTLSLLRLRNRYIGSNWASGDVIGAIEFYTDDTSSGSTTVRGKIQCEATERGGATPYYVYYPAITFWTATTTGALSEKMRLTDDGCVGLGTTSPVGNLEIQAGLTTTGSVLTIGTKETTVDANDILGSINFYAPLEASGGDAVLNAARIYAKAEASFTSTVNSTTLVFATGNSEAATDKMWIKSDGDTFINGGLNIGSTTAPGDNNLLVTGKAVINSLNWGIDSSGSDTYAITLSPALAAYTAGLIIVFKAGTANTGAATLNVNGLGAKTIKKSVSTDLSNNDILANMTCTVVYDGTYFILMNPRTL